MTATTHIHANHSAEAAASACASMFWLDAIEPVGKESALVRSYGR
jgi:hypothetical protein